MVIDRGELDTTALELVDWRSVAVLYLQVRTRNHLSTTTLAQRATMTKRRRLLERVRGSNCQAELTTTIRPFNFELDLAF